MTFDPKQQTDKKSSREDLRKRIQQARGCSIFVNLLLIGATILLGFWSFGFFQDIQSNYSISYSEFKSQLNHGNVDRVTLQGNEITGELKQPVERPTEHNEETYTDFRTYVPEFGDENLLEILEREEVQVITRPTSTISWGGALISFLPFLVLFGLGYFLFRRMQSQGGQVFSMGKSKAQLYDRRQEGTKFDDIAGLKGVRTELQEIIDFLKNPYQLKKLGGVMPKGVLLVGPPGTGKTLLARAVAGEAQVPFFSITGSDFMEMFVGVGASRVRDLFNEAKSASPAIIFIDELDSIGRRRGAGLGGGHDEREQTLNQLLSEMDGFEPNTDVIVIAATNRPDILDQALLRPGRFDRRITVDLPTTKERLDILKIHTRNKPLATDINLNKLAQSTPGFSGADLENVLNEAALLAARRDRDLIQQKDIEDARDKVTLGLERENLGLTKQECRTLAYHEAGHTLIAALLPNTDPIHKVTIVPRGRAMGVTQQLPERDKYLYTRRYLLDRLKVMMGGRAAESLVMESISSGAENDLKQATRLARKMVLDWGMSERLSQVAFGGPQEQVFLGEEIAQRRNFSEETAREIDEEIKQILEDSYQNARQILKDNHQKLDKLVEILLEKEEISGNEVAQIIEDN